MKTKDVLAFIALCLVWAIVRIIHLPNPTKSTYAFDEWLKHENPKLVQPHTIKAIAFVCQVTAAVLLCWFTGMPFWAAITIILMVTELLRLLLK